MTEKLAGWILQETQDNSLAKGKTFEFIKSEISQAPKLQYHSVYLLGETQSKIRVQNGREETGSKEAGCSRRGRASRDGEREVGG